jgi:hypothetical protein
MKQLKVQFKDGLDVLEFIYTTRQSGLYLWDTTELQIDLLEHYNKPLPRALRLTKSWYYDTDVEADFNKWISYMTLAGYALQIKMITKPKK